MSQRVALSDLILKARQNTCPEKLRRIYSEMYKHHGGLCLKIEIFARARYNSKGWSLDDYATHGYFWAALPDLVEQWDKVKGAASTCLRKIILAKIRTDAYWGTCVGAVRVPADNLERYTASDSGAECYPEDFFEEDGE